MIQFAYPNVNDNDEFAGCGRYLTTTPDDPALKDGYKIADPNVGRLSKITTAASILAKESFGTGQEVYEYKDDPAGIYLGDSMGLAYLLALIKRSRRTRWEHLETPVDIWCTGSVDVSGERPCLINVFHNLFDIKLQAFLADEKDPVFFVPFANLKPKHTQLFREQGIRLFSLDEFNNCPLEKLFTQKTIVGIHGNELHDLVHAIFMPPAMTQKDQPPSRNPYRGLFAFREEDAEFFFGRETYTQKLLDALEQHTLIPVIGASGSGKSSLIYAGLIPKLRQRNISRDEQQWGITSLRPGDSPFKALARALLPSLYEDEVEYLGKITEFSEQLLAGKIQLCDVLERVGEKHGHINRILLFVDQFEEIYTLGHDDTERCRFMDELLAVQHCSTSKIVGKVILTMRADFLGKALAYHPFADILQHTSIMVGPMRREELREAIEKPAERLEVTFEGGLADRILKAVSDAPGNLPLLQFTLSELWENQTNRTLTNSAYDELGRVERALTCHADRVYEQFVPEDRNRFPRIFTKLVRPGEGTEDTRRVATRQEIGTENWPLVSRLADSPARLVVADQSQEAGEVVEIVHETLITEWQRLREWIDADREFLTWQEHLRNAMRRWKRHRHDQGMLLQGTPLSEAEDWLGQRRNDLAPEEKQFIEAGLHVRQKARFRRRLIMIGGFFLAIAAAVVFGLLWNHAETQRRAALEQTELTKKQRRIADQRSLEALAVSAKLHMMSNNGIEAMRAILHAGKLLQQADVPESLRSLVIANFRQIVNGVQYEKHLLGISAPAITVAFHPEGTRLAVGGDDGTLTIWDVLTGEKLSSIQAHDEMGARIAFSPDGAMLASGGFDGVIKIWRVADGHELRNLQGHTEWVSHLEFSPDGKMLASTGGDGLLKLWNLKTHTKMPTLAGHAAPVSCLAFLRPDGTMLASGGDDGTIKLWEVATGEEIKTLPGYSAKIYSVDFSPDGKMLVSGSDDGVIRLWNVEGANKITNFPGHAKFVSRVRFSPDGLTIASVGDDKLIKLWSVETGKEIRTLQGHREAVYDVCFSPDGSMLASAGVDQTIRLWEFSRESQDVLSLDELLLNGCQWMQNTLKINPALNQEMQAICGDILKQSSSEP